MKKLGSLVVVLAALIAAPVAAQTVSDGCIRFDHLPPGEGYSVEEVFSAADAVFDGTTISVEDVAAHENPLRIADWPAFGRSLLINHYRVVVNFPRDVIRLDIRGSSNPVAIAVNDEERTAPRFSALPPFADTFMTVHRDPVNGDLLTLVPDNAIGIARLEVAGVEVHINEVCVRRMAEPR